LHADDDEDTGMGVGTSTGRIRTVREPVDDVERVDKYERFEENRTGVVDDPDSAERHQRPQP
jgi:hypothetical protein